MKRNNIYKGLAAFTLAGMLAGCSSDYLDVDPVTNIPEDAALNSPTGVRLAVEGIFESMNKQYGNLDWNGNCGEAYVGNVCNDAIGPDLVSGLWGNFDGFCDMGALGEERAYATMIAWNYYYTLIAEANRVIGAVHVDDDAAEADVRADGDVNDDATDTPDEGDDEGMDEASVNQLKFSLAQALTMRAHAYQKLMGLYAPRFEDSKGGEAYTIVLRTAWTTDDAPLAKYKDVYEQIYKDLDRAIRLYGESGLSRESKSHCDASVAHGIYARAALANHDWKLAQEHAAEARKGYTVMDADTYLSGFTEDCTDYIWHMDPGFDTTYYWSFGSHNACNGGYVNAWAFGAGAINMDLYRQTDPKDIRRKLYMTPDKVNDLLSFDNPGKIKEADFWDASAVDATDVFINLASGNVFNKNSNNTKSGGMYNVVAMTCYNYAASEFKGDLSRYAADDNFYNYYYRYSKIDKAEKDLLVYKGTYVRLVKTPFGAQFKFWGDVPYGNMAYPWMRASEMALAEAEAYYELNDEKNAKKCLEEVMKNRVKGYTCNKSGEALRDEIRVNRRMELFMEGQNFTDFKRWNIPAERRAWKAGDVTSGNAVGFQIMPLRQPSDCRGWRWIIPYSESQYNSAIDRTLID